MGAERQFSKQLKKNPPPKKGAPRRQLDPGLIYAMLMTGFTKAKIARQLKVSLTTLDRFLKREGIDLEAIKAFKTHKSDLLAWKQSQIVGAMTPETINEAGLRDQATALKVLDNVERLERGLATQNVDVRLTMAKLCELEKEEQKLLDELTKLGAKAEIVEAEVVKRESEDIPVPEDK